MAIILKKPLLTLNLQKIKYPHGIKNAKFHHWFLILQMVGIYFFLEY